MSRKRAKRRESNPAVPSSPERKPLRLPAPPGWTLGLLALLAAGLLFADDASFLRGNPQFLDHTGRLLLTAADGYHYLALSDAAQRVGAPGFALPGLSYLALQLSNLLGADLLRVAFWLPPLLAIFLAPALVLLGREVGLSRGSALLAAVLACAAPYWHARSNLGYFDTDCLIAPLVVLAGWGMLRFGQGGEPRRWAGLALAASCLLLLRWWWGASAWPVAAGFAGAYALSVATPSSRAERLAKVALLAGGVCLAALFALRHAVPLPGFLAGFFESVASHVNLVIHEQAAPVQVGSTIGELKALGLAGLGEVILGYPWILVPALAGLAVLVARQWPQMLLLLPLLGLGGLSLASVRFAIFLGPLLGLGLGALADAGWAEASRLGTRTALARAGVVLVALALAGPAVQQALTLKFPPPFTAPETALAAALGREAAARGETGSVAWLWWDYGYLVDYYARMEPLFDGGSQEPGSCFRAAFPLALADPALAAGWMKALARDGGGTLASLNGLLGRQPAMELLVSALPQPGTFGDLAAAAKLPDAEKWRTRLFPSSPVYLYLPLPMLDRLPVLWRFAASEVPGAPADAPEFLAKPRSQVRLNPGRGSAAVDGRELPLSLVVQVLPQGVQLQSLNQAGQILVDVAGLPRLYLLHQDYARTLLFRLLFTAPLNTPGFRNVAYDSRVGGVWRVE
jgi:hypothetical protein